MSYGLLLLFKDREAFAALVREVASPDVGRMGIEILSFTIKDIEDHVDYLDSLGKTQTAKVKRDADIGVAESNRDAGIRVCITHRLTQYRKVPKVTIFVTFRLITDFLSLL